MQKENEKHRTIQEKYYEQNRMENNYQEQKGTEKNLHKVQNVQA